MLEFPETTCIAKQLRDNVSGLTVRRVLSRTKIHKFCWFNGDPSDYDSVLSGQKVVSAEGFGIYAELSFSGGDKLCVNDGVNVRYVKESDIPKDYQLTICFENATALVFTVAMYGGIFLHDGAYDNEYYIKSKTALSPLSAEFDKRFYEILSDSKPNLSAKAFLATEQRFPGIGNGVIQDILFTAGIHPKRKVAALDESEKTVLLESVHSVIGKMTEQGGRNTEKDLFGNPGGYETQMSKNTKYCPACSGEITKETYLGGSIYYCPSCQKL